MVARDALGGVRSTTSSTTTVAVGGLHAGQPRDDGLQQRCQPRLTARPEPGCAGETHVIDEATDALDRTQLRDRLLVRGSIVRRPSAIESRASRLHHVPSTLRITVHALL